MLAIDARGQDPDPDSRGPQIYRVHLRLPFHGSFCTTSSYHRFAISLSPRADARCRGERHAAFWPARSCSKTSLTCAVRSVLFFDTLPIGFSFSRAAPLIAFEALRTQRHFGRASASGRPLEALPIEPDRNMFENARPLFVHPRVVVGQPMLWSIPPRPLGWGEVSIMITSGGEISPDTFLSFSKDFDWFGIWDCWVTTQYSERRVCASRRILPWISKELLERRFNACGQYGTKLKIGNWMWSEAKLGSWRRDTSVRVRWERSSRSNVSKYNYETCKRSIRFKDDN